MEGLEPRLEKGHFRAARAGEGAWEEESGLAETKTQTSRGWLQGAMFQLKGLCPAQFPDRAWLPVIMADENSSLGQTSGQVNCQASLFTLTSITVTSTIVITTIF